MLFIATFAFRIKVSEIFFSEFYYHTFILRYKNTKSFQSSQNREDNFCFLEFLFRKSRNYPLEKRCYSK